ncbi:terminase large subunit [Aeromonas phage 59.1]|nr:terminase large subunit [Aeromonas phage 59.1]
MIEPRYARAESILKDTIALLLPPSRMALSESAKEVLYVNNGGGNMIPFDLTLTPYMKGPMDCAIGPEARKYSSVIFAGPARTGKTAANIMGSLAHIISRAPGDTLFVHMTQKKAQEWRKTELERLLRASPEVRAALSPRPRDNNVSEIILRNGTLIKIAHPSPAELASSTFKNVLMTDYDRMPADNGEGAVFDQAAKRTQTYGSSSLVLAESSPGFDITDPTFVPASPHEAPPVAGGILALYNQGDRRLYYWQCPDCGEWHSPTFADLLWDTEERDPAKASKTVELPCPHCGTVFQENQMIKGEPFKRYVNNRGIWVPEGCQLDQNGVMTGERRESTIASFWQHGPSATFQTWRQLVFKYATAKKVSDETGDFEALRVTINVDQGRPFTPPRSADRDPAGLAARREDIGVKVVPDWARFLLASIDVQGGKNRRWVVQVQAFGKGLRSAIIDRFEIVRSRRGREDDPKGFVRVHPGVYAEDWDLLIEKVMYKSYLIDDGSGRQMGIYRTSCDSNGEDGVTDQAYQFWRRLKKMGLHHKFFLVKGGARKGSPMVTKTFPDNTSRNDRKVKVSGDVPVYLLQSDKLKDIASASLNRLDVGPRHVSFPEWLPESFFSELMSEERDASGHWDKISPSASNEGFDLVAYNWAVLHMLKADKIVEWDSKLPAYMADFDSNAEVFMPTDGEDEVREIKPRRRRRRTT